MPETLEGQLEQIVYFNDSSRYNVAKLEVKGLPDLVTVVGPLGVIAPGELLKVSGTWEIHPKYGQQFKASGFSVSFPAKAQGIEKYLGSGLIRGIGPEMAKRLVRPFGDKTLEVIEHRPKELLGGHGIGKKRLEMIRGAWEDQREVRDVMIFLQGHGVSTGYSAKIFKQYGQDAIRVVRENPYRLTADIFGIGFIIADGIAEKIGIPRDSLIRGEAGILHVLEKMCEEGHVYGVYNDVLKRAEDLLEMSRSVLERAFVNLVESRRELSLGDLHFGQVTDKGHRDKAKIRRPCCRNRLGEGSARLRHIASAKVGQSKNGRHAHSHHCVVFRPIRQGLMGKLDSLPHVAAHRRIRRTVCKNRSQHVLGIWDFRIFMQQFFKFL